LGQGGYVTEVQKKTKLIVKTLKCQYLLGFSQGLERKRMFFFLVLWQFFMGLCSYSIISSSGAATTFPKFSSTMLLFFLFHRVISGFFVSSDHFDFCGLSTGSWWKTRTSTWVAKIQNLASYITFFDVYLMHF
jgi:hypothetical protein